MDSVCSFHIDPVAAQSYHHIHQNIQRERAPQGRAPFLADLRSDRMKAEERKEIEANKLQLWLGRMKTKMQGRSLYVFVGTLVMVIAVGLIVWFWRSSVAAANSARWIEMRAAMDADEVKKYDEIIGGEKHNDKPTVKIARFLKARRVMYRDGMDRLGSPDTADRTNAFLKVEEGRKLYEEVANELADYPALQQEAWFSCAKAEESLLAVPRADGTGMRGDFNRMIEFIKKAAAINGGSDASKNYDQKVATRSAQRTELEDFYRKLYEFHLDYVANNPKFPKMPKFPGGGFPGGGFPGGGFPGGGFPGGGFDPGMFPPD